MIFRLDADGNTITAAGRSDKMTGHSAEQFVEDPVLWKKLTHPDDLGLVEQQFKQVAQTGSPDSFEMRMINQTGEIHWIRLYITPRLDASGDLVCCDGVAVDITDQKEAQFREAQHAAVLAALAEISQVFASSLELKEILDSAVRRVARCLIVCARWRQSILIPVDWIMWLFTIATPQSWDGCARSCTKQS